MKIIWDPLVKQQIEQIFRFNQTTFGTSKAKHIVESIYQHINLLKNFLLWEPLSKIQPIGLHLTDI